MAVTVDDKKITQQVSIGGKQVSEQSDGMPPTSTNLSTQFQQH